MSERVKAEDLVHDLRQEFNKAIRSLGVLPPALALEVADVTVQAWIKVMEGMVVSGGRKRRVDPDAVAADWHRGLKPREIARRHACSRRTVYNYHPSRVGRG